MFKRRNKLSAWKQFTGWLWPRIGLQRWAKYHQHRVSRISDSPYRVAAGLACGIAISFTPFLGLHVLLAVVLAYFIRANLLASAVGTIVGNPWTFPLIWVVIYEAGAIFQGLPLDQDVFAMIDTDQILSSPREALAPVFEPMVIGGFLIAPVVWVISFIIAKRFVLIYQNRRREKLSTAKKRQQTDTIYRGDGTIEGKEKSHQEQVDEMAHEPHTPLDKDQR